MRSSCVVSCQIGLRASVRAPLDSTSAPQARIMYAQARFENLATFTDCFESLPRRISAAIVSSQIAKHLFAFEDRSRSNLFRLRSTRGDVGSIPAFWQTHFHCAYGKSLCLRPQKCEALQPGVLICFAVAACHPRSHFASSRAQ